MAAQSLTFEHNGVRVDWVGGGLVLEARGVLLVLDCPAGIAERTTDRAGRIQGIVTSSGRMGAVRGLLGLLEALARVRSGMLPVWAPAGEERVPSLVAAWQRGWPDRYPVMLDGSLPGQPDQIGPFEVTYAGVHHGEPDWREDRIVAAVGSAVQVDVDGVRIVWVPGAAPGPSVRRVCTGASLAVVEVGVTPWPRSEKRWRMGVREALDGAQDAETVWLVGDDGDVVSFADA